MDRSWISTTVPGDPKYKAGVLEFISFAIKNKGEDARLPCPCYMCHNFLYKRVDEILNHLDKWAFDKTYTCWIWHGEDKEETSTGSFLDNENGFDNANEGDRLDEMLRSAQDKFDDNPETFETLLSDSEKPLYAGSKYTKLSSILRLYNIKAGHGWTDRSFSLLLDVLKDILPEDNVLPSSTYEAKKSLYPMGLQYEKIHACSNDCILFRKEYEPLQNCPKCKASRYKKKEGVPAKTLWYFPIIPWFRRLFSHPEDAERLTWHKNGRKDDGLLRHPADSPQWKFIDGKYHEFGKEERNLRLALSTDGMNPFRSLSSTYSTWPVILVTYNLPPSLCMKRKYMMLSLLISGPKQPGNDIDVYLEPLIDDLKLLWEKGVSVFDAYRNETFNLRAMLFCTIQDYPAYGNVSGYTVKGEKACPVCDDGMKGEWLSSSRKMVYTGYRAYLPHDHHYRKQKKAFNGEQVFTGRPMILTGEQVFEKIKDIDTVFGKKNKSTLPKQGYKKCSVFWSLPYWRFLFIRHCLDAMHIEKNVCDSVIGTLLNIPGKTKDGEKARDDLKNMGIRSELHVVKNGNRKYLPPAAYTLSKKEKKEFCESLARVKVPDGYSSNISSLVSMENLKLMGLKSHDCHVLLQQLLPVAIRSILPKNVRYAITRLCLFFNAIFEKVVNPKDLDALESDLIVTLCQLEMYFPPSFFDIMVHLTVHLVREVRFCGPVYLRNQYPFERQMKTYKGYVKNLFRPEACIAERLLYESAVEHCNQYLTNVEVIGVPTSRNSERIEGEGIRGRKQLDLSFEKWHMAHTYILLNEDEVVPYVKRHLDFLKCQNRRANAKSIATAHNKSFVSWFKDEVMRELLESVVSVSDRLKSLAYGPNFSATFYSRYIINRCTFSTSDQDERSTTQNSGVTLEAMGMHFASAKDNRPLYSKMQYYGVIEEICEMHYSGFTVPLFGCKWADNNTGVHTDDLGYTLVNFDKSGHVEDPFILASQAKKVFYMSNPAKERWFVVITPKPRYAIDDYDHCDDNIEFEARSPRRLVQIDDRIAEDSSIYVRNDHNEGIWIEENRKRRREHS
ncbi:uncharacterized protein LOC141590230 [Silene latifolia]|uniref:uncharacterized protein LOC141590230 n=1 Tax=Silene latifolia TaxID=37657 RepID=UPI003D78865F